MTEATDQTAALTATPDADEPVLSAGGMIRRAREASGLHIAALAVSLKVPVKRLEALEADRFELLPNPVFTRALAGSVCRALRMDPADVLERLPRNDLPQLAPYDKGSLGAYVAPSANHRPAFLPTLSKPAVIGGLLLICGAAAVLYWPLNNSTQMTPTPASAQGTVATVVTTVVTPMPAEPPAVVAATSVAPPMTASVKAAVTGASSLPVAAVLSPSSGSTTAPAASAVQAALPEKPPTTGIVVFSATAPSWVEVTDAKGVVLLRRMLSVGEVAGASGVLPLNAVVGRADVTKVQVRGQAFDLAPVARDNVARFEVK
jgi:cytoskeleton protein RodZ